MRLDAATVPMLRAVGTIPGVAILHAAGRNGPGIGLIASDSSGRLRWRAPGSASFGPEVEPVADGQYVLEDGADRDKFVRVQTYSAFMINSMSDAVYLDELYGTPIAAADIDAADASTGKTENFVIPMFNDGNVIMSNIVAWLDPSAVDLEISDDPGGPWITGTTEATGFSFGDIPVSGARGMILRRTIGAASPADPDVLNLVHVAFDGL